MNEKSKRNIILIIIAVFVIATGLISLAMYNITKSSGKKNSKDTTATMSDAGSITTEAGTTEVAKDPKATTEQATTTEEVKDFKATTEAVASGGSKKDESSSNPKPSSNSSSNNNSNSGSTSGGNNNSGNQKPNNSSSGSSNNSNNSSSSSGSGSGSTNPSNGNSSNSNSSNSGNNSSSSSGSGNNNSQSSCSHNWVQVFIHHDQVKHTEYYTTTEIIGYHSFCRGCNLDLTATYGGINDAAESHLIGCNASYEGRPIYQEKQVPYDVIDQEAYDEPAGYKCSICGATK